MPAKKRKERTGHDRRRGRYAYMVRSRDFLGDVAMGGDRVVYTDLSMREYIDAFIADVTQPRSKEFPQNPKLSVGSVRVELDGDPDIYMEASWP